MANKIKKFNEYSVSEKEVKYPLDMTVPAAEELFKEYSDAVEERDGKAPEKGGAVYKSFLHTPLEIINHVIDEHGSVKTHESKDEHKELADEIIAKYGLSDVLGNNVRRILDEPGDEHTKLEALEAITNDTQKNLLELFDKYKK